MGGPRVTMKKLIQTTASSLALALAAGASDVQNAIYRDSDWNASFAESCGYPRATSIKQVTVAGDKKLKFTLRPGDIGKCSTDNRARHSAPFWERAEVSQETNFQVGQRYRINAEITFLEGFTGERETFFQIHGWAHDCRHAYPPVMVKFRKGRLAIETLRGVTQVRSGHHRNVLRKKVSIDGLYGKPLALALDFDIRTRPGTLSVSLNGTQLVADAPVEIADCAIPHIKFGIYRSGWHGNETSAIVFDDLKITTVK